MKRMLAIVLCVSLSTSACASAGGARYSMQSSAPAASTASVVDPAVMAEFVQRIPAGSRVRVERVNGNTLRGTILKSSPQAIVLQRNTRVPEPPVEVPYASIARVTLDDGRGSTAAKSVAIGVASGVATFLGILAIIAASWD